MRESLAVLTVLALGTSCAHASWGPSQQMCVINDARITEASGIAMSRRHPGVFYVHNDSGDSARFFAVSKAGKVLGEFTLPGVTATDWEDLAVGYDAECRPTVYLADIGDNPLQRSEVVVYAVQEPALPASGTTPVNVPFKTLRFKYPDKPHDAEALMADWKGRVLYIVTKETSGPGIAFRVPAVWDGTLQTAARVGTATFTDPIPQFANLATAGDISADGSRMVVRTYQRAYEWTLSRGETPEDAFKRAPSPVTITLERQGEAICYGLNNRALVTTTEGTPTPVTVVPWKRP